MKTSFKLAAITAAAMFATASHAQATYDANIELDLAKPSNADATMSGRVELNALATLRKEGDNFVNAKATLEVPTGSGDQVNIADAWLHFGDSTMDLKVGRQEAADLFPLGKDVVVESAGTVGGDSFNSGYRANKLRGRVTSGAMHLVAGFNAAPGLRAEVGFVSKNGTDDYGLRPTVVYTMGDVTLKAGVEALKARNGVSSTGVGVSVAYVLSSDASMNANYAKNSKLNGESIGVNATFGSAGVGYVLDKDSSRNEEVSTIYAAYSMPLMGVEGATVTPALSISQGTGVDDVTSLKVRFNYSF